MDFRTYQSLRAYCLQDLGGYLSGPKSERAMQLWVDIHGEIGRIQREQQQACSLFQCIDLTPRELAAADLLAVISNHRAITWQREPSPPNGRAPAPPLDAAQASALERQTHDAVRRYAAFLPESERAVLQADHLAAQASDTVTAPIARLNGVTAVSWKLPKPKALRGYGVALYEFLKQAYADKHSLPTARDVLDAWRCNRPSGCITEVMENGVKYENGEGTVKEANLEAIRKAISRMTTK